MRKNERQAASANGESRPKASDTLVEQVVTDQLLQEVVPINFAD